MNFLCLSSHNGSNAAFKLASTSFNDDEKEEKTSNFLFKKHPSCLSNEKQITPSKPFSSLNRGKFERIIF